VVFRGYVDGSVDFFDHKIEEMTGYPRKDFESRQRKWTELIMEDDIAGVKAIFIQALKNGKSYVREYKIRDRHARILWIQERSQIISDKSGQVQYVSGIFFDITAQKKTEEAMQEGERFLSSVFASIIDGISILDLNFTIVQVNPIMEKWYAHALPLVGKKCYEVYQGRSKPCESCPTHRTMLTSEPHSETIPLKGLDDQNLGWLEVHTFPWLRKTTGKMKGVITNIRDITHRVAAEKTIKENLRDLQKALNGCLNKGNKVLKIDRIV